MSKISCFEDLIVWQESMQLCIEIYQKLNSCRDFGFRDQIRRASVSVPSNIAEGFERNSNKEFSRYLKIAKGSSGETRTQLYIGKELTYISELDFNVLIQKSKILSQKLQSLINSVEAKIDRK